MEKTAEEELTVDPVYSAKCCREYQQKCYSSTAFPLRTDFFSLLFNKDFLRPKT